MSELDWPRHRWQKVEATGPKGDQQYGSEGLWIWGCEDCLKTCDGTPDPNEPPPDNDFCPGRGPHNARDIVLAKLTYAYFGWEPPERLREG